MERYTPAILDEKDIVTDFLNDFMQSWDNFRNGHNHAIIGAPLETNKPYICEWNDQYNWVRFKVIDTIVSDSYSIAIYEDNKRLADAFCKEHDENLLVIKEVNVWGVLVEFKHINI